ncbi:MAG: hypothetical protein SFX18_13715 [Pirellulales bacterium]|nr:hypothetical protein [Pirellulales bacterium]
MKLQMRFSLWHALIAFAICAIILLPISCAISVYSNHRNALSHLSQQGYSMYSINNNTNGLRECYAGIIARIFFNEEYRRIDLISISNKRLTDDDIIDMKKHVSNLLNPISVHLERFLAS